VPLTRGAFARPNYLEPVTARFIESLAAQGGPPIYTVSIADARHVLETVQAQPIKKSPADIDQRTLAAGPTGQISIRTIRPPHASGQLPVIMYFHGGGWILGGYRTHDRLLREIANGTPAAVVFVEYEPPPEAKYPVAIGQAYAATTYIAEHGGEFNLDGSRLAVTGDSVGGNMAAVVALLAKERSGPRIQYQALFYPVTDANLDNHSYREFAEGPWLTRAAMEWFWNAYAPDSATRKQPTVSPLQASADQLRGLPAALAVTDENDVLRAEGEAYAGKLMQAGVSVTAVRYLGTIHNFVIRVASLALWTVVARRPPWRSVSAMWGSVA
jgi:acetyl esterase